MIHKLAILGILASIAYMVYSSMYLGKIYIFVILAMIVLSVIYYVTTSVITRKMVEKGLGKKASFALAAGIVSADGTSITPGMFIVSDDMLLFYKRKGDLGGVSIVWSLSVSSLGSYSIGKIDEHHIGIEIKDNREESVKFSSRKFPQEEGAFRKALGWS